MHAWSVAASRARRVRVERQRRPYSPRTTVSDGQIAERWVVGGGLSIEREGKCQLGLCGLALSLRSHGLEGRRCRTNQT